VHTQAEDGKTANHQDLGARDSLVRAFALPVKSFNDLNRIFVGPPGGGDEFVQPVRISTGVSIG
jgi:hypothetical protein